VFNNVSENVNVILCGGIVNSCYGKYKDLVIYQTNLRIPLLPDLSANFNLVLFCRYNLMKVSKLPASAAYKESYLSLEWKNESTYLQNAIRTLLDGTHLIFGLYNHFAVLFVIEQRFVARLKVGQIVSIKVWEVVPMTSRSVCSFPP